MKSRGETIKGKDMTVLLPVHEFEMKEFEDSIPLKGFYRDLNSKEIKELEKKHKEYSDAVKKGLDLEKKLKRTIEQLEISKRKEDWEQVEKLTNVKFDLEDKLMDHGEKTKPGDKENDIVKWKMNICLTGDDKDKIIALAESYGCLKVEKTIIEAIQEKKQEK